MQVIIIQDQPKEQYGIYGNRIAQKGEPDIMQKSQDSIGDRFGLDDSGDAGSPGYAGDGAEFPFRQPTGGDSDLE
jgi:hypothetical protein